MRTLRGWKGAHKTQGPAGFADYRKMLAEVKPDIVAIGTRHVDEHRDMALAAVEQARAAPTARSPSAARSRRPMRSSRVRAARTKYAVAHRNRYHPVLATIDGLIESDTIGRVLELRGRGKEDARGGALDLWVLGSHVLNLANYFSGAHGPARRCCCKTGRRRRTRRAGRRGGRRPDRGNEVHARFETERGMPVFFESIAKAGNSNAGFGCKSSAPKASSTCARIASRWRISSPAVRFSRQGRAAVDPNHHAGRASRSRSPTSANKS